jgi:hypothetical protein
MFTKKQSLIMSFLLSRLGLSMESSPTQLVQSKVDLDQMILKENDLLKIQIKHLTEELDKQQTGLIKVNNEYDNHKSQRIQMKDHSQQEIIEIKKRFNELSMILNKTDHELQRQTLHWKTQIQNLYMANIDLQKENLDLKKGHVDSKDELQKKNMNLEEENLNSARKIKDLLLERAELKFQLNKDRFKNLQYLTQKELDLRLKNFEVKHELRDQLQNEKMKLKHENLDLENIDFLKNENIESEDSESEDSKSQNLKSANPKNIKTFKTSDVSSRQNTKISEKSQDIESEDSEYEDIGSEDSDSENIEIQKTSDLFSRQNTNISEKAEGLKSEDFKKNKSK